MKKQLCRTIVLMTLGLASGNFCSAAETAAPATISAAPKVKFETNYFDFGKVTSAEKLKGSFKFKNVGNAELKFDAPTASCDCTEAKISPDTVPAGGSGEVTYSIKMDHAVTGERVIHVHSNDPENPDQDLTVALDYTPLFETTPPNVHVLLGPGKDQVQTTFVVNRMDGKPLGIDRLATSEQWITAEFDPSYSPNEASPFESKPAQAETTGRIIVTVKRPSNIPSFFKAKVELWNGQQSDHAAKVVEINGQIQGEIAADPARLEWAFADLGNDITQYSDIALSRHIKLISAAGKPVEFKKISTDVPGLTAQITPTVANRLYDLVLKFDKLPHNLIDGKVTLETTLETLPKLEIPVHVMAAP